MNWLITLLNGINQGLDAYNGISSIFHGKSIFPYMERITTSIEKISNNLYYAPSIESIKDINKKEQDYIKNIKIAQDKLMPVQKSLSEPILATGILSTPMKLKSKLLKNPEDVLDSIKPLREWTPHLNKNMIPIMFSVDNMYYIGWQLKGAIPLLFDCEIENIDVESSENIEINELISIFTKKNYHFIASCKEIIQNRNKTGLSCKIIEDNLKTYLYIGLPYNNVPAHYHLLLRINGILNPIKLNSLPYRVGLFNYINQKRNGMCYYFMNDGNILLCSYVNDIICGEVAYIGSGRKIYSALFKDGSPIDGPSYKLPSIFYSALVENNFSFNNYCNMTNIDFNKFEVSDKYKTPDQYYFEQLSIKYI
jgi:hypothetical protein